MFSWRQLNRPESIYSTRNIVRKVFFFFWLSLIFFILFTLCGLICKKTLFRGGRKIMDKEICVYSPCIKFSFVQNLCTVLIKSDNMKPDYYSKHNCFKRPYLSFLMFKHVQNVISHVSHVSCLSRPLCKRFSWKTVFFSVGMWSFVLIEDTGYLFMCNCLPGL